ncbi:hypothetical protein PG987_007410 [Apiospora arundinis]
MAGFASIPIELIFKIGHHLSIQDLRNLAGTCTRLHNTIVKNGFVYEEEVTEEYDFDQARLLLKEVHFNTINLSHDEIHSWPQCRAEKFSNPKENKELFDFLDNCIYRWGAGILYFLQGHCVDLVWEKALVRQLPAFHRRGSLLNRAISTCFDLEVISQIIDAYSVRYSDALFGLKDTRIRRRYTGLSYNNDPAPVFWACSEDRADVLDLLYRTEAWTCFYLVTDSHNQYNYSNLGKLTDWVYFKDPCIMDAWERAFRPIDILGRKKGMGYHINESACIWLIQHTLGFSSRPNGIPMEHPAEAALQKKHRLVRVMILYYKKNLSPKKYERALTLAVQATSRGWIRKPTGPRKIPDGHEEILDTLLAASTAGGFPQLRQKPHRYDDRGLLAHSVRSAPRNALYLLQKQMSCGDITDHRDVRAALIEAIPFLRDNCTGFYNSRELFFQAIFPWRFDLACDPKELNGGKERYEKEVRGLCSQLSPQAASEMLYDVFTHYFPARGGVSKK